MKKQKRTLCKQRRSFNPDDGELLCERSERKFSWEGARLRYLKVLSIFLLLAFIFPVADLSAAGKQVKNPVSSVSSTNYEYGTNAFLYTTPEKEKKPFSVLWTLLQSLVVLAVIGVVLYYFLKFIMKKQSTGNLNRDLIRVISQNSIAVGKYITIARIMSHYYILSIAENHIGTINQITEKDEIDRLKVLESEMPLTQEITFSEYLRDIAKPILGKKDPVTGESTDGVLNFLKKQKDRLNKLNGDRK